MVGIGRSGDYREPCDRGPAVRRCARLRTSVGPTTVVGCGGYEDAFGATDLDLMGRLTRRPRFRETLRLLRTTPRATNQIANQGVTSLVAPPTAGVLTSLQRLILHGNQITDEGCAAFASAISGGALPAISKLDLQGNYPASEEAQEAIDSAFDAAHMSRGGQNEHGYDS